MNNVVNLAEKFAKFSDCWSPKIIGDLNDCYVKAAKFRGEFTWHKHDTEDELIMVVRGSITIQFRDRDVEVSEGEFFIVPKGVEHCPKAEETADVLLLEPKSTLNTGDVINERTVEDLEWI
ncbi:MAG: cupin domain-containing protein [Erysipelotrichaceae bacterium]|nr:cupin domain-containing protein [Erysipelotrichaceae bacterium]